MINADSAQVYRDLRIVSARPTRDGRGAGAAPPLRLSRRRRCPARRPTGRPTRKAAIAEAHDGGPAADPGRRHRPLHPHPARRHRAGARDRPGDPRGGARHSRVAHKRMQRWRARIPTPRRGFGRPTRPGSRGRSRWSARPAGRSPNGRRSGPAASAARSTLVPLHPAAAARLALRSAATRASRK